MRKPSPLFRYWRSFLTNRQWLFYGLLLSVATLLSSIGLLGLSGGFLTATAIAGLTPAAAEAFNVVVPSGGVRLFAITRTAGRWSERVFTHEATFRLIAQLRIMLYRQFSQLGMRQLGGRHSGDLLNRLTKDIDALDNLYQKLVLPIVAAFVIFLFVASLAWWIVPTLVVPVVALAAISLVAIPGFAVASGKRLSPDLVKKQSLLRRSLLDLVDNLDDMILEKKAWADRQKSLRQADSARIDSQTSFQLRVSAFRSILIASVGLAVFASIGILFFVTNSHAFDPAWVVAFLFVLFGMMEAVQPLPQAWVELPGTSFAAQRLNEITDQIPNPAFPIKGKTPRGFGIEFVDVSFGYDREQPIFTKVNWHFAAGEHVAVVGPSGGGKTTLAKLLSRLEDPLDGEILLGEVSYRDVDETILRDTIACSLQDPWIMTATIEENLRLADESATDERLWDVLEVVGLQEAVRKWPERLKTWLDEGGESLSGGQRKRLATARTLLRSSAITVLDEPTEGLDSRSAIELVDKTRVFLRSKTLIWVTHRPQGLADFDRIIRVESGQLIPETFLAIRN